MGIMDIINKEKEKDSEKLVNPIKIFDKLTKEEGYGYLRSNQVDFLEKWFNKRKEENIVGILNTGAGKTLIGLLMLMSKMNELGEPVIYLCPDNQLVGQVVNQAKNYGIQTVKIDNNIIPMEFINSEAILVTTFEKLFNGKSIFGIAGLGNREIQKIGCILIDDAHSCIKKAKKQATIIIGREKEEYEVILSLFKDEMNRQSQGKFISIFENKEESVVQRIPYWIWKENIDKIERIINKMNKEGDAEVIFAYNLIIDILDKCQCFISGNKIEIVPWKVPLNLIPSYNEAKHKYVLSATFNNNHKLISELGIKREAVENPIKIESFSDIGEKLIIIPERYHKDMSRDFLSLGLKRYSEKCGNVVVLASNTLIAKKWETLGAKIINDDIDNKINNLRSKEKGNFYVIVNRYDGIDLNGKSCNFLVIDGLPKEGTLEEQSLKIEMKNSLDYSSQLAQKIEQALGRSVRSGSDYSTVFILGDDLIRFITNKENIKYLSKQTQVQLDISLEISDEFYKKKDVKFDEAWKEIVNAIRLVYTRNKDWRIYYQKELEKMSRKNYSISSKKLIELAEEENEIFKLYVQNSKFKEAWKKINQIIENNKSLNQEEIGRYYQVSAEIMYNYDKDEANKLQIKAYDENYLLLKPMFPNMDKRKKGYSNQVKKATEKMKNFSNIDLRNQLDKIISNLEYSNEKDYKEFEKSIKDLGEFIGFMSSRPETELNDGGPDNLWENTEYSYIIECKNQVTNGIVDKDELGQLSQSMSWYNNKYNINDKNYCGIMFHPSNILDKKASVIENVYILNTKKLELLLENLKKMKEKISNQNNDEWNEEKVRNLLQEFHFLGKEFKNNYCVKMKKNK